MLVIKGELRPAKGNLKPVVQVINPIQPGERGGGGGGVPAPISTFENFQNN